MTSPFDQALRQDRSWMEYDDGTRWEMPVDRWHRHSDRVDDVMLSRCHGPTLDVGCGPGRLTLALMLKGAAAMGIDTSAAAVRMTRRRGGLALLRNVFEPVPGEGRWRHVLLADGNLGIGGDPRSLLGRVRELLHPAGSAVVEVSRPGTGLDSRLARIAGGPWFRWSAVGVEAMQGLAEASGFRLAWQVECSGRWFVELMPRCAELDGVPVHGGVADERIGSLARPFAGSDGSGGRGPRDRGGGMQR